MISVSNNSGAIIDKKTDSKMEKKLKDAEMAEPKSKIYVIIIFRA